VRGQHSAPTRTAHRPKVVDRLNIRNRKEDDEEEELKEEDEEVVVVEVSSTLYTLGESDRDEQAAFVGVEMPREVVSG
jgi:hypothetical protein